MNVEAISGTNQFEVPHVTPLTDLETEKPFGNKEISTIRFRV